MDTVSQARADNVLDALDNRPTSSFYWSLTILATLGGFLFGFDTANIGSALPFIAYHLNGFWTGYLVAGASLGAAVGAIAAGPLTDRFGRRAAARASLSRSREGGQPDPGAGRRGADVHAVGELAGQPDASAVQVLGRRPGSVLRRRKTGAGVTNLHHDAAAVLRDRHGRGAAAVLDRVDHDLVDGEGVFVRAILRQASGGRRIAHAAANPCKINRGDLIEGHRGWPQARSVIRPQNHNPAALVPAGSAS
jgi:hypothetical protein